MADETKRRLLISKWRGAFDRAKLESGVDQLLAGANQLVELASELTGQDERIATLEDELEGAQDRIKELEAEADAREDELTEALERVKYWLHDGIVHGKLVSDPRRLLRTVEDAL